MGACVSILIRHDFYDLDNPVKTEAYINQTIEHLRNELKCAAKNIYGSCNYYEEDKWCDAGISIISLDVTLNLRRGYWETYNGHHYCQVVMKRNGQLHISDLAFQLTRLFGQNEAWYCDDYLTDECMMMTLDELIEVGTRQHDLEEFPYAELMKLENVVFPEYKPFYHDSFGQRNE